MNSLAQKWNIDRIWKSIGGDKQEYFFSKATLENFLLMGKMRELPRGFILVREGERMRELGLVLSGRLRLAHQISDAQEKLSGMVNAGEVYGLIAVLEDGRAMHQIIADRPCVVLTMNAANLRTLIDYEPRFRWQILVYLASKLRQRSDMLDILTTHSPRIRLAKELIALADQFGEKINDKILINHRISQAQIGAKIGISRQSTNKHLRQFEADGLIAKSGHKFMILQKEALLYLANAG